jgi:hypothetical protein
MDQQTKEWQALLDHYGYIVVASSGTLELNETCKFIWARGQVHTLEFPWTVKAVTTKEEFIEQRRFLGKTDLLDPCETHFYRTVVE